MWNRLIEIFDVYKVVRISIVGLEQTGKTNNALYMANLFENLALDRGSIPLIFYERWRSPRTSIMKLERLRDLRNDWCKEYGCSDYCPDSLFIIFDDISFISYRFDHDMKKFMHYISRIAHRHRWARRIAIVNIFHYSKATLPFIRISHVRILTSLSSPMEVAGLKDFFTESSLWNFYNMKIGNIRRTKYYALYNIMGYEFITRPPRSPVPQFIFRVKLVKPETENQKQDNIYIVEFSEKKQKIPVIIQREKKTGYTYIYYKQNGKKIRILKLKPVKFK